MQLGASIMMTAVMMIGSTCQYTQCSPTTHCIDVATTDDDTSSTTNTPPRHGHQLHQLDQLQQQQQQQQQQQLLLLLQLH